MNDLQWVKDIEARVQVFAQRYAKRYSKSERELAASFEIGCFHAILSYYETQEFDVSAQNLTEKGEFRYLTSPSGNPNNFSYISLTLGDETVSLRQQARVKSHIHPDIEFTPDMVILKNAFQLNQEKDKDYAGGKRTFYTVATSELISAFECKSMNPFPELLISFVGVLVAAHDWFFTSNPMRAISKKGLHLAPTLFVGGAARALHFRMVEAMQAKFPINILLGMHKGTWKLKSSTIRKIDISKIRSKAKVKP